MLCVCAHCSVVHGYVAEQIGHGLSVVDPPDGLGQDHADVHRLDLWTLELLQLVWDGVGHNHLGQRHKERGSSPDCKLLTGHECYDHLCVVG